MKEGICKQDRQKLVDRPCQVCDAAPLPSSVLDHVLDQHGEEGLWNQDCTLTRRTPFDIILGIFFSFCIDQL